MSSRRRRKSATRTSTVCAGLLGIGITHCSKEAPAPAEPANGSLPSLSPRVKAIQKDVTAGLRADPLYERFMQDEIARVKGGRVSADQVTAADVAGFAALAAKGQRRLSPSEVSETAAMKLKLAQHSQEYCAALWSGGAAPRDIMTVLDGALTDSELRRWFEISVLTVRLELHAEIPPFKVRGEDFAEGMRMVVETLPPSEGEALMKTSQTGAGAPPDEGCKALEQLVGGALALPEKYRDPLLRGMFFGEFVDAGPTP
jgi:hypothetical protein